MAGADDKNLTGEQIQNVLDLFLYKALEPIVKYSTAFDHQIVYLLGLITRNKKRKLSSIPREEAISFLARALAAETKDHQFEMIRAAKIERNFIHVFINQFLSKAGNYLLEYSKYLCLNGHRRKIQARRMDLLGQSLLTDRRSLYVICLNSHEALQQFYKYRAEVLGNYVQLASKQAKAYTMINSTNTYDFQDVRQTILRAILTAIDKYDSSKGALTSYINWWILNAQTCSAAEHEYGIAFTMPQSHKRRIANNKNADYINFSVSLDQLISSQDDGNEDSLHNHVTNDSDLVSLIERDQTEKIVQYITKCLDPKGVIRLTQDIGEYFSQKEYKIMEQHMAHNNIPINKH
jgi:hypothetical protein